MRSVAFYSAAAPLGVERACTETGGEKDCGGEAEEEGFGRRTYRISDDVN